MYIYQGFKNWLTLMCVSIRLGFDVEGPKLPLKIWSGQHFSFIVLLCFGFKLFEIEWSHGNI